MLSYPFFEKFPVRTSLRSSYKRESNFYGVAIDCIKCHGRLYTKPLSCGHAYCPVYTKVSYFKTVRLEKEQFVGTAPTVFVGRYNYPHLNVGILAPPDRVENEPELYDAPREWSARNFQAEDVLSFRGALINSRFQTHIKQKPRFLALTQEVAMASKPVDVEFLLEKKPVYQIQISDVETVLGARAVLKKAVFQENPHIPVPVEKVVSDTDLKAVDAMTMLYRTGFNETQITRLLSVGTLGVKIQRKLVPTRFSITAVDDHIGKGLIEEIKDYDVGDYRTCFGGYLGNYYLILFFPQVWSYELFEMYMPSTLLNPDTEVQWSTDHEFYSGRKTYAEQCAGGYYAARLPVLEKLKEIKKQQGVFVLRFITDEYTTPLGVFVCREAARMSLKSAYQYFDSKESMIRYAKEFVMKKFGFDLNPLLQRSVLLQHIAQQKKLLDFL